MFFGNSRTWVAVVVVFVFVRRRCYSAFCVRACGVCVRARPFCCCFVWLVCFEGCVVFVFVLLFLLCCCWGGVVLGWRGGSVLYFEGETGTVGLDWGYS